MHLYLLQNVFIANLCLLANFKITHIIYIYIYTSYKLIRVTYKL